MKLVVVLTLFSAACSQIDTPQEEPASDGGSTDASSTDAGSTEGKTIPSPPAEILRRGSSGFLLRGTVLTPTGVLDPGEVLIVEDSIRCVATDCSAEAGAQEATWIETHGTISPGLIDSHNHMSYNFLPEWVPPPTKIFKNRYEWANDPGYEEHIRPYAAHRSSNTHFCPASKWAELRSLVHGTTTMQGEPSATGSCINGGVRNANGYHGLGYDHMRGNIGSVRDLDDQDASSLLAGFAAANNPITRYHVHMAEGISGDDIDLEFDSFAGRDPRANRHSGQSLLVSDRAILIHSMKLNTAQLEEAAAADAKIVWSPSSNFALYGPGQTAPIREILALGITTGIGPDWTLSGADDMLSELRVALDYGAETNIPAMTTQKLWEMATLEGAEVVGLGALIGRLEVGYRADVTVFGRMGPDPYQAVLESRAQDVRLVLINGEAYFGDQNLSEDTARNSYCEQLNACGAAKYVCAQDSPSADNRRDETMADIRSQLVDMLNGTGIEPFVEIYGRGDELLELVDCSL